MSRLKLLGQYGMLDEVVLSVALGLKPLLRPLQRLSLIN